MGSQRTKMIVVLAVVEHCAVCGWTDVLKFNCRQDDGIPPCTSNACNKVPCTYFCLAAVETDTTHCFRGIYIIVSPAGNVVIYDLPLINERCFRLLHWMRCYCLPSKPVK